MCRALPAGIYHFSTAQVVITSLDLVAVSDQEPDKIQKAWRIATLKEPGDKWQSHLHMHIYVSIVENSLRLWREIQ
jgi:hypothetical protein